MESQEKVEVIDLIISVLKDHEKVLDNLIGRMELSLERRTWGRIEDRSVERVVKVSLKSWGDFKEMCYGSDFVTFDFKDGVFHVSAFQNYAIFQYEERIPNLALTTGDNNNEFVVSGIKFRSIQSNPSILYGQLKSGLVLYPHAIEMEELEDAKSYRIIYQIDLDLAREWLSEQLGVEKKSIVVGKIDTSLRE